MSPAFAQFFAAGLVSLTGSPNAPAGYIFAAILLALLDLRLALPVRPTPIGTGALARPRRARRL
ncbi:hypothetical protein E8F11_19030 [Pseudomonas sp. BN417]|nr:hypothetical protein [Pseudomonas sp. BN417]